MRDFVLIVERGEPVPGDLIERCSAIGPRSLAYFYEPPLKQSYSSLDGHAHLQIWSNDTVCAGTGPDALLTEAHGGALLPIDFWYGSAGSDPVDLCRILAYTQNRSEVIAQLGGTFCMLYFPAGNKALELYTSISGQPPVFYGQNRHRIIVSTRGILVNRLLHPDASTPVYEKRALADFVSMGCYFEEYTPYKDVFLMPINTRAIIAPNGIDIAQIDSAWQNYGHGELQPRSADFDDYAGELIRMGRSLASAYPSMEVELSGGKDSRILAAALHGAGEKPKAYSFGWSDHPDVILGGRLAKQLGWEHRAGEPEHHNDCGTVSPVHHASLQLRSLDCMSCGPIVRPATIDPDSLFRAPAAASVPRAIGGGGGEFLRGGFAITSRVILLKHETLSPDVAENEVRRRFEGRLDFFDDETCRRIRDWTASWIGGNTNPHRPEALLDRLYAYLWGQRCWASIYRNYGAHGGGLIQPLVDNRIIRFLHRFRVDFRCNDVTTFEVIRRLAPTLENLPLCNERWGFELRAPRPGDEEGYAKRTPLPIRQNARDGNYSYQSIGVDLRTALWPWFAEHKGFSAIYDIIDRDRIFQILNSKQIYHDATASFLWRVFAAGMLVSNEWAEALTQPETPISVRHDRPWWRIRLAILDAVDAIAQHLPPVFSHYDCELDPNQIKATQFHRHVQALDLNLTMLPSLSDREASCEHGTGPTSTIILRNLGGSGAIGAERSEHFGLQLAAQISKSASRCAFLALQVPLTPPSQSTILSFRAHIRSDTPFRGNIYVERRLGRKVGVIFSQNFSCTTKWNQIALDIILDTLKEHTTELPTYTVLVPLGLEPNKVVLREVSFEQMSISCQNDMLCAEALDWLEEAIMNKRTELNQLCRALSQIQQQFEVSDEDWEQYLREFILNIDEDRMSLPVLLSDASAPLHLAATEFQHQLTPSDVKMTALRQMFWQAFSVMQPPCPQH